MAPNRRIDFILLVLTVCHITIVFSEGPRLVISPSEPKLSAPANKPYGIICTGKSDGDDEDGNAFTEMHWLNPKGEAISEGTPGVKPYGENSIKLSFFKPSVDDSGIYNCSALYRNTQTLQVGTIINFYEDISWQECEEKQSLIFGTEGKISCKTIGNPKPNVNWEKDHQPLSPERYAITSEGITISNVINEDKGLYIVEAFVPTTGKTKYKEITVTVQIPPKINDLRKELRAIEGEQYTIQCEAEGFPMPKYAWYDPQSRDLSEIEGFSVNKDDGTLLINRVERNSGGDYKCTAENPAGRDEKIMNLFVLVKPVIHRFENMTKKEKDLVEFECQAEGDPQPLVTIRKEGNSDHFKEDQDDRMELQTTNENGVTTLILRIKSVKRSDGGMYYCAAENGAARVEKPGHLEVQFPPNMTSTPTTIVKAWAGNPANLSCIAEANPNATIIWKFDSKVIEPDDTRYIIYGGTSYSNLLVKINEIPNQNNVFGAYACEAINPLGEAAVEIRLELATEPGPLSQVLFDKATSTTITFKFLGPSNTGGLPIIGYVVKYWKEDESESQALNFEWLKESSYILSNLKPRTHYKFSFAAKNNVGVGDWTHKNYVMPVERNPETPLFVTEMMTVSEFSDRFEIKWIVPDDNGEPIQHFEIRYFRVDREINGWKQIDKAEVVKIEHWENPVYELTGLSPNTNYKVELRANNKLGNSIPGIVVFRTRSGEISDEQTSMIEGGALSLPGIIAIVVVAVLIMLILLDVTFYMRFHCGLLYVMRYHTCGRSPSAEKVRDVGVEEARECVKEVSTANNGKIKTDIKAPSPKAVSPVLPPSDKTSNHSEEKPKTEVDNPAFEIRDGRPADLIIDENFKNKSPKGSKSSIGKSSPV